MWFTSEICLFACLLNTLRVSKWAIYIGKPVGLSTRFTMQMVGKTPEWEFVFKIGLNPDMVVNIHTGQTGEFSKISLFISTKIKRSEIFLYFIEQLLFENGFF